MTLIIIEGIVTWLKKIQAERLVTQIGGLPVTREESLSRGPSSSSVRMLFTKWFSTLGAVIHILQCKPPSTYKSNKIYN